MNSTEHDESRFVKLVLTEANYEHDQFYSLAEVIVYAEELPQFLDRWEDREPDHDNNEKVSAGYTIDILDDDGDIFDDKPVSKSAAIEFLKECGTTIEDARQKEMEGLNMWLELWGRGSE